MLSIGESLDYRFVHLINSFPPEVLKLNGIYKIDPFLLAEEYYKTDVVANVSIDPNANINGKSPVNFQSEIFKPILKLRAMHTAWKTIDKKWGEYAANECLTACLNGKLYHHDWTKYDVPYCFAPDSSFWMHEGRPYGWLPGGVPKKLQSFIGQTVEVAMDFSQENAGAIGIANVLVNAAFYYHKDKEQLMKVADLLDSMQERSDSGGIDGRIITIIVRLFSHSEKDYAKKYDLFLSKGNWREGIVALYDKFVEDLLQHLVHVLHNTFRVGGDSPFTNISIFCRETIKRAFADARYPDMTSPVDILEDVMHIQMIFAKFFAKGSPLTGKNYRFPICTVNIATKSSDDFTNQEKLQYPHKKRLIKDKDFVRDIGKLNAKRGVFNFHQGEKLASCCRLTSDLAELKSQIRMDSFGNGGMSIGSHRVVALNLHSIACEAVDIGEDFVDLLIKYLSYAEMLLVAHKEWLKYIISTDTLKFFRIGWADLNMFFSTFGFVGIWDAYNTLSEAFEMDSYVKFAKKTINNLEEYAKTAGKQWEGFAFNVEEVPAENAAPKLAKIDNFYYNDCRWYQPLELLSNQMIPLYYDCDAFERLSILGELMESVSGGAIGHLLVDGSMTEEASIKLIEVIIEDYAITHFAIEIGTTTCMANHTSVGIHPQCPSCGGEISTWTRRVVGFNSDTDDWTSVRRDWENIRRKVYSVGEELLNDN